MMQDEIGPFVRRVLRVERAGECFALTLECGHVALESALRSPASYQPCRQCVREYQDSRERPAQASLFETKPEAF